MVLATKPTLLVGQVITQRRNQLQMSQIQLAIRVSYPLYDIVLIEKGDSPLVGDEIVRFAAALNMNQKELCPIKGD